MVVGTSKDEREGVGHFPFEFSKESRRGLRRALYSMQVETKEKLGASESETSIYHRLVPLELMDANCLKNEHLGKCFTAFNAIKGIPGAPNASRGRRFVGRFLQEIFSCFFRSIEKPFPNVFFLVSRSQSDFQKAKDVLEDDKTLPSAKKARMA